MTFQERIDAKANEIELLTEYANGVTGHTDSNIGDAIKTLCDGFGGGSGDVIEGVYTATASGSNKSIVISHDSGKIPKRFEMRNIDNIEGRTLLFYAAVIFLGLDTPLLIRYGVSNGNISYSGTPTAITLDTKTVTLTTGSLYLNPTQCPRYAYRIEF